MNGPIAGLALSGFCSISFLLYQVFALSVFVALLCEIICTLLCALLCTLLCALFCALLCTSGFPYQVFVDIIVHSIRFCCIRFCPIRFFRYEVVNLSRFALLTPNLLCYGKDFLSGFWEMPRCVHVRRYACTWVLTDTQGRFNRCFRI